MIKTLARIAFLAASVLISGCPSSGTPDAGPKDSGTADAAVIDSGRPAVPCAACDGGLCDPDGRCVSCGNDSQCPAGSGTHCETRLTNIAYGTCVVCVTGSQCGANQSCDPAFDSCGPNCRAFDAGYCSPGFCDPSSGSCVECLQDNDCTLGTAKFCDPSTLRCVECRASTDCPYSNPGCLTGTCGACTVDRDCEANQTCVGGTCTCSPSGGCGGNAPLCVLNGGSVGTCGCTQSALCMTGQVCNPAAGFAGACQIACTQPGGACNPASFTPACNPNSGLCQQCLTDMQCSGSSFDPYCSDAGSCVECNTDSQCAAADAGKPYCASNFCSQCVNDPQCQSLDAGTPYCSTVGLGCVECNNYTQCPPNLPGCSSGTCGACFLNSDCPPPDGCNLAGQCAPMCTPLSAPDSGCAMCFSNSDCADAGPCDTDAGTCR